MNYLKSISLMLLFAFLAGCFGPPPTDTTPPIDLDDYYEERKKQDEDRDSVFDRSFERYRGSTTCEEELEDDRNHDCKDLCRDIYSSRSDREDCEDLPVAQIERLEHLHDLLEDPDDDDLADVDFEDFDTYLNVSTRPFDRLVGRYSSREAEEMLLWIVENDDVADVIEKEEDDYGTLKELLESADSSGDTNSANIYKYFTEVEVDNDPLMEYVISQGNDVALEWFTDFINDEYSGCNDETSSTCFVDVYCVIGDDMDDDLSEDWLDFTDFEDYINDVIDCLNDGDCTWTPQGISGTWQTNESENDYVEDLGDWDEEWTELCPTSS